MPIHVALGGIRVGRASGNDLTLNDPSISRFQCRLYYKDGRDLCVSDLASTNETLVNDKPVTDVRLFAGDRITIGESVLKVVCDTLNGPGIPIPAVAAEAPARLDVDQSAVTSSIRIRPESAGEPMNIDLGLGPEGAGPVARKPGVAARGRRAPNRRAWGWAAGMGIALAAAGTAAWVWGNRPSLPPTEPDRVFEIRYEKIEATEKNIFRYDLVLQDGILRVRFDDLNNQRQGQGERKLADDQLAELRKTVSDREFLSLNREYEGMSPESHYLRDLTVVIGNRSQRVRVRNRPEPEAFQRVRERLETFALNELGLESITQSREKLLEDAQAAWLNGRKLFEERDVRRGNLARALREMKRLQFLVQTIEPRPPFFEDAVALQAECGRMLDDRFKEDMFQADQAIRLRDWETANRHLLVLQELLNDRSDERYDQVYKKLIDVQRRLKR